MLTLDLGNSWTKVRAWGEGAPPKRLAALDLENGSLEALEAWLEEWGRSPAALSSVAEPTWTERVATCLAGRGVEVLRFPDPGIENRTRTPETVGADRLYAARGALGLAGGEVVVCDLGTALTVDAARLEGSVGAFLGGAIAAGPELQVKALARETARLPEVDLLPGVAALGRDTLEALRAGAVVGIRGMARELVEELVRAAGFEAPRVFVSGGGRDLLLRPRPFRKGLRVEPDLVHLGLIGALRGWA